jgi:hypothetical protein
MPTLGIRLVASMADSLASSGKQSADSRRSLVVAGWTNTTVIKGGPAEEVAKLRQQAATS